MRNYQAAKAGRISRKKPPPPDRRSYVRRTYVRACVHRRLLSLVVAFANHKSIARCTRRAGAGKEEEQEDVIGTRAIYRRMLPERTYIETSRGGRLVRGVGNICRPLILVFAIGYLPVNRNFPSVAGYFANGNWRDTLRPPLLPPLFSARWKESKGRIERKRERERGKERKLKRKLRKEKQRESVQYTILFDLYHLGERKLSREAQRQRLPPASEIR